MFRIARFKQLAQEIRAIYIVERENLQGAAINIVEREDLQGAAIYIVEREDLQGAAINIVEMGLTRCSHQYSRDGTYKVQQKKTMPVSCWSYVRSS